MNRKLLDDLRDLKLNIKEFRSISHQLSKKLADDVRDEIEGDILLLPILRAGIALLPSFLETFHEARVGFIGLERDDRTKTPRLYFQNIPEIKNCNVIILEPMIATGGTLTLTLEKLKEIGADLSKVRIVNFISSEPGITRIQQNYPNVKIISVATDPELDQNQSISPGLGDFGDRYFGN